MSINFDEVLNSEQKQAILEESSLLLVACPGSGKTRALTYKIAYELERLDSGRQFIVAITYTNRAAEEIKERLDRIGISTEQLWIGTIHSFCLEWIVRPYHHCQDDLKYGFALLNSHDSEVIITDLCTSMYGKKLTYYDCDYFVTPRGYKLGCLEDDKHGMIKKVLAAYFKILKANRQIDFELILFHAYSILKNNPIVANTLKNIFPFILIDEYQDTKEIQYHIISQIIRVSNGSSRVFIVGDPNQSIYSTLGGFPMEKNDLDELLGFKLKEYVLTSNYRSSEKIIDYYNNFKVYPSTIVAEGELKSFPSKITYNTDINKSQLVDELVRLIKYSIESENILEREICVVAPQWIHLGTITRQLTARLPNLSFDGPGMVPFSRDLDNIWFKIARLILSEPSPLLYTRRLRWAKEIIQELENSFFSTEDLTGKKLLRIINSIHIAEKNGLHHLELFFARLMGELKIDISLFPNLSNHYDSFFSSSKARIDRLIKDGSPFMNDISVFRKAFKPRSGITISTIHGTKGEEYDTVIAFALLNDYVPHFKDTNGDTNSNKLLYVLASRARKHLHLISEKGWGINYYNPYGKLPSPNLIKYRYNYDDI